jgi:hypothetical protein
VDAARTASLGWAGETDHEPLTWRQTDAVPYGDKRSFVAAWSALVGDGPSQPYCSSGTVGRHTIDSCRVGAYLSVRGVRLFVDAELTCDLGRGPGEPALSVTDDRD